MKVFGGGVGTQGINLKAFKTLTILPTSIIYIFQTFTVVTVKFGDRGGTVVKVLCYKSEGRWLDPS